MANRTSDTQAKPKHTLKYAYTKMKNRRPALAIVVAQMKNPPKVVLKGKAVSNKSMEAMEGRKDNEAKGKDKND